MKLKELMNKPLPDIPSDILESLNNNKITTTKFESKNDILIDVNLQSEVGYKKMEDGTYLVSMICPMPNITIEMIEWWFWWHPQANERYQVWFPREHFKISYAKKDKKYFTQQQQPTFCENTQYPKEKIGKVKLPLRIDFISFDTFGFSKELMKKNNIPLIVCGHVGVFKGLIWHTEMAHIFKKTDDGLLLISRFWIGKKLNNPILRKIILKDKIARDMAEHCCIEYRNLVEILPELYISYK